jgi:hypothetical protein
MKFDVMGDYKRRLAAGRVQLGHSVSTVSNRVLSSTALLPPGDVPVNYGATTNLLQQIT